MLMPEKQSLWEIIKKYWKWIVGIVSMGIGLLVASKVADSVSTKVPLPDVKKETKDAEKNSKKEKDKIDKDAEEKKKLIKDQSTEETLQTLSKDAQSIIDSIKKNTTNDVAKSIMDKIKERKKNE